MNYFLLSLLSNPLALAEGSIFSQIVDILFEGSSDLMTQLTSLIRTAANGIIYADGTGTSQELSTIFTVILVFVGIAIVFGLVFGAFQFIKFMFSRTGR